MSAASSECSDMFGQSRDINLGLNPPAVRALLSLIQYLFPGVPFPRCRYTNAIRHAFYARIIYNLT